MLLSLSVADHDCLDGTWAAAEGALSSLQMFAVSSHMVSKAW